MGSSDPVVEVVVVFPASSPGKGEVGIFRIDLLGSPKRNDLYSDLKSLLDVCKRTFFSVGQPSISGRLGGGSGSSLYDILPDADSALRALCEKHFLVWNSVHPVFANYSGWSALALDFGTFYDGGGYRTIVTTTKDGVVVFGGGQNANYGSIGITSDAMSVFGEKLAKAKIRHNIARDLGSYKLEFSGPKMPDNVYSASITYKEYVVTQNCTVASMWFTLQALCKELDRLD